MNTTLLTSEFKLKYGLGSPFDLDNEAAYQAWCEYKMGGYPHSVEQLVVEIDGSTSLSAAERGKMTDLCRKTNMALYAGSTGTNPDLSIPEAISHQFELYEPDDNMGADDGITAIKVADEGWRGDYIPYSTRPIHWHTDGYYNDLDHQICALLLHCVSPAANGGENALLDHEVAYIHLRDTNLDYIHALMQPDVMRIPANINEHGRMIPPIDAVPFFPKYRTVICTCVTRHERAISRGRRT